MEIKLDCVVNGGKTYSCFPQTSLQYVKTDGSDWKLVISRVQSILVQSSLDTWGTGGINELCLIQPSEKIDLSFNSVRCKLSAPLIELKALGNKILTTKGSTET